MGDPDNVRKSETKKSLPIKKRRLGLSKHRLVEVVPREMADAEITKLFENSKIFPEGED
jgi:hypothetical protein